MSYASEQLADSPMAAWMLNDPANSATVADSSGNSRPGANNGAGLGRNSLLADGTTAADFDGNTSSIQVAGAAWMNTPTITLEAVVRPFNVASIRSIMDRDSPSAGSRCWQFRISSSGKLELLFWDAAGVIRTVSSSTSLPRFGVTHCAATYDGSDATVWVNGVADGSLAVTSTLRVPSGSPAIQIGRNLSVSAGAAYWPGSIGGAAIYGSALSGARLAAHAAAVTAGGGGGGGGLVGELGWGLMA